MKSVIKNTGYRSGNNKEMTLWMCNCRTRSYDIHAASCPSCNHRKSAHSVFGCLVKSKLFVFYQKLRGEKFNTDTLYFECDTCHKKSVGYTNPDGVSICEHCGALNMDTNEPYCPSPDGTRYSPEEWDRLYGDKKE